MDDLANIMYRILEVIKIFYPYKEKTMIEVNVTNGELVFGEMIRNLLPKNQRMAPRAIIPPWLEKCFLKIYVLAAPRIKSNSQLVRRLADFAKRSSLNIVEQEKSRLFKTAEEIKKLALDKANYTVLYKQPILIIIGKNDPIIYALQEKSEDELKQIVQKAI